MTVRLIRSLFCGPAVLSFISLVLFPSVFFQAIAGPVSSLYVTGPDYNTSKMYVLQGTNVTNTWEKTHGGDPFVVMDTIRMSNSSGAQGAEYTLSGTFTGNRYPGQTLVYDATTDGQYIYAYMAGGASTLSIYRYDLNWSNCTQIIYFATSGLQGGITYDPTNNSLWINDPGGFRNVSMTGEILSSFPTISFSTFLAMDYADGTLWTSRLVSNELYQYSRDGTLLSTQVYTDPGDGTLYGGKFFAGEFQYNLVPIPSSLLLFGSGLLGFARWRRLRKG